MERLSEEQKLELWGDLEEIQGTFPFTEEGFLLFAQVVINVLIPGAPDLNRVQADMCRYLFSGPKYRMLQAQRGQAKTTLTAIFAVFCLIHRPSTRVVIFSQTGKRAKEISSWVVKIFNRLDFLDVMRPDVSNGDRESVEAFDVHWLFKGDDKSPSVVCQSIEAGAQGARADLLIADDIESLQNSKTVTGRETLEDTSKEFESINQYGDIVYLGTPQSIESIYNNLPSRGYDIRIWPGRYPNAEDLESYGPYLAPILRADMEADPSLMTGGGLCMSLGKPTCPEMFPEEILQEKELSQGLAKFKLQYLLNTKLTDEERFPLKLQNLIVYSFSANEGPVMPIWASGPQNLAKDLPRFGNRQSDHMYHPIIREYDWQKFDQTLMYVDPAGGGKNGDETAWAIIKLIGTYIYIYRIGGVAGGYEEDKLLKIVDAAKEANCKTVYIEKNYGHGAHASILRPLFEREWPVVLEEVYEAGQKELRIIDVVEPVLSSHRLVVSPDVVKHDFKSVKVYPSEKAMTYSLFFQMGHLTRDKDCLVHDDRIDALAGAIRQIVESIDYDMKIQLERKERSKQQEFLKAMADPISHREYLTGVSQKPNAGGKNRFGAGPNRSIGNPGSRIKSPYR